MKDKEKVYYEKDEEGSYTGITAFTIIKGEKSYTGFSFCHPGHLTIEEYLNEDEKKVTAYIEDIAPDAFNKVAGKGAAKGRALKLMKLIEAGRAPNEALHEIYSNRMLRRIQEFQTRQEEKVVLVEEVDNQEAA